MDVHLVDRPRRGELEQNEIARQWQPHREVIDHDHVGAFNQRLLPIRFAYDKVNPILRLSDADHTRERVVSIAAANDDGYAVAAKRLPDRGLKHTGVSRQEIQIESGAWGAAGGNRYPADDRVSNSEGIEMAADRVSIHDADSSMHRE
jgi:hypothetical protein